MDHYYYQLVLDGISVSDPASQSFFGTGKMSSAIEVPSKGEDFYEPKDVPHGQVRERWYYSASTKAWRRCFVYTPPDYDAMTAQDWPDASGDQAAWEADVKALADLTAAFRQRLQSLGDDGLQQALPAYLQSPQPTVVARRLTWIFSHDAYHTGQIQYVRALQEIPADRYFLAAVTGDAGRLGELLDAHPDLLNAHSREGWTALQRAAYSGHRSAVDHLLARGADLRAKSRNDMANTALHGAIAGKRAQIVSVLLDRGADAEATDSWGNTALHLAVHAGTPEIVEMLLRRGVTVNARRNDGLTPLGVAAKESPAMADLLRAADGTE